VRRKLIYIGLFLLTALFLSSGCAKKPALEETKPSAPVVNSFGVIDMQKAIQDHPNYPKTAGLQKELNTVLLQIQQRQSLAAQAAGNSIVDANIAAAGIKKTLEHEFQIRMAAKQNEINARMEKAFVQARQDSMAQMKLFEEETDREFQPQLINIQLKLRVLQLTEEEKRTLQQDADRLEKARLARLTAYAQRLSAQMATKLAPQQTAGEQELAMFAQQLQAELAVKEAEKMKQASAGSFSPASALAIDGLSELQARADQNQQKIAGLQDEMVRDIRDKAAKIAVSKQLDVVLANVLVNSGAVDITDAVIAEFKK